ncbi:hypothetical protein G6F46_006291 [Rhizopus delemar]|uniref:UBZ4-type domain-containing protein n=3 Tax=Rhizopus TaxID=4842 RepID=I1CR43_RHIO9|nr:hypothetical protein RO3G_15634 [Rhizopus delemar RA 99-880]KAG1050722.1 hypothetical protein G6F43_007024 [Rhizopus delemar]KAG1543808.1 hypothetical protein G6F51_006449 [Rhizopus arrhizus]KAG1461757.1 hypothetical protein G6F55_003380 [Rhizopus delemar]KAG1497712.1 hypothetical protein G6F54_005579 [Rhizopus delemar]|eukprot:EIE90923.1 hypothetical protein RO3G_15634 [Rhizopus delemar RA 99-880]
MSKKQYKLYDLYQKKKPKENKEEQELKLALELSKKEHILEQKRLFELLKQQQQQSKDDDDDDWFQTISYRAPTVKPRSTTIKPKKSRKIKTESQESLVIDDLSMFLKKEQLEEEKEGTLVIEDLSMFLKKEDPEEQQQLVIENLTEFLQSDHEDQTTSKATPRKSKTTPRKPKITNTKPRSSRKPKTTKRSPVAINMESISILPNPNITVQQTEKNIKCPVCDQWFVDELSAQQHLPYCNVVEEMEVENDQHQEEETLIEDLVSESDCSVVDLCNPQEDDDGYLSPLEGFTNILDIQGDNPYLAQFESSANKSKRKKRVTTPAATTTTAKPKRKFWRKRAKKRKTT